jgi:hypothetical protein
VLVPPVPPVLVPPVPPVLVPPVPASTDPPEPSAGILSRSTDAMSSQPPAVVKNVAASTAQRDHFVKRITNNLQKRTSTTHLRRRSSDRIHGTPRREPGARLE